MKFVLIFIFASNMSLLAQTRIEGISKMSSSQILKNYIFNNDSLYKIGKKGYYQYRIDSIRFNSIDFKSGIKTALKDIRTKKYKVVVYGNTSGIDVDFIKGRIRDAYQIEIDFGGCVVQNLGSGYSRVMKDVIHEKLGLNFDSLLSIEYKYASSVFDVKYVVRRELFSVLDSISYCKLGLKGDSNSFTCLFKLEEGKLPRLAELTFYDEMEDQLSKEELEFISKQPDFLAVKKKKINHRKFNKKKREITCQINTAFENKVLNSPKGMPGWYRVEYYPARDKWNTKCEHNCQ